MESVVITKVATIWLLWLRMSCAGVIRLVFTGQLFVIGMCLNWTSARLGMPQLPMPVPEPRRGLSPVSVAIGFAGLAGLAALWLSHVHAITGGHVLDCGRFITSWTDNSLSRPCRSALNARFAAGFMIGFPAVAAAWAVQLRRNGYLGGQAAEPLGSPRADFRVGARVGRGHASYPLAKLSVTPDQAVIRSPVGSAVVERPQVQSVHSAGKASWIAFGTIDRSGEGLRVFCREPEEVLATLARLGWPVR